MSWRKVTSADGGTVHRVRFAVALICLAVAVVALNLWAGVAW